MGDRSLSSVVDVVSRPERLEIPRLTFTLLYETGVAGNAARWRFVLRSQEGHDEFVAEDEEPGVSGERLELLTIVRALESLNQPARVIIWTRSSCVREGFLYGLQEWPASGWTWDCFGQPVPVKNRDLWQRIARATQFHDVECRVWRIDPPHCRVHPAKAADDGERTAASPRSSPIGRRWPEKKFSVITPRPFRGAWTGAIHRLLSWFPRISRRAPTAAR